jgi:hypothetical protein
VIPRFILPIFAVQLFIMKNFIFFLATLCLFACSENKNEPEQKPATNAIEELNTSKKENLIELDKQKKNPAFSPNIVFDLYGFFYTKQEPKTALRLADDNTYKIVVPLEKGKDFLSVGRWALDEVKGEIVFQDDKTNEVFTFELTKDIVLRSKVQSGPLSGLELVQGKKMERQFETNRLQPIAPSSGLQKKN